MSVKRHFFSRLFIKRQIPPSLLIGYRVGAWHHMAMKLMNRLEVKTMKNLNRKTIITAIALAAAIVTIGAPVIKKTTRADSLVQIRAAVQQTDDATINSLKDLYDSSSAFLAIHSDELAPDVYIALDTARSQAYNSLQRESGYVEAMSGLRIQLSVAEASLEGRIADTNAAPAPVIGTAAANRLGIGTNWVSANTANTVATIYATNRNLPADMIRVRVLNNFVERLYSDIFGRPCDQAGRDRYVNDMINGTCTADDVVKSMFASSEFTSRNLSDETFMTVVYRAFLDREPDAQGLNNWVNQLRNGMTRSEIVDYFSTTENWAGICTFYGINK